MSLPITRFLNSKRQLTYKRKTEWVKNIHHKHSLNIYIHYIYDPIHKNVYHKHSLETWNTEFIRKTLNSFSFDYLLSTVESGINESLGTPPKYMQENTRIMYFIYQRYFDIGDNFTNAYWNLILNK